MNIRRIPVAGDFFSENFHHPLLRDKVTCDERSESIALSGDQAGLLAKRLKGLLDHGLRRQCFVAAL